MAIALTSDTLKANVLESRLRREFHIITRVSKEQVLIDVRTLLEGDIERICQALSTIESSQSTKD